MKVRKAVCIGAAVVLAWGMVAAQASTTLPYSQSFESWTPDAHWAAVGGTVAASAPAKLPGSSGNNGLSLDNSTVTLEVDNGLYNNVWIQIYARPVVGATDPTSVAGQSGAFYLRNDGALRACIDAALNTWVTVATGLPQGQYLGFTVHADYSTDTWELYYSASASQVGLMTKATAYNSGVLPFATTGAQIDNVSISSGDPAYVDLVAVSRANLAVASGFGRVATKEHLASASGLQDFTLPAYSGAYVGNNALGDDLGNDILSGLVDGDSLQVWDADTGTWEIYGVSGNAFDLISSPTSINRNSQFVYTSSRMLLDQNNTRNTTFGFYPYVATTVLAYQGVAQQPGASANPETLRLNGSGDNAGGFTAINWIDADTFGNIEIQNPDANLTEGDRMYVAGPSNPNSFTEYWWDNANWRDFNNNSVATKDIVAGSKIWTKRTANAFADITVTH